MRRNSVMGKTGMSRKFFAEDAYTNVDNLRRNYKSQRIEELKEIFRMYDKANVGYINQTTLKFLLRGFGQYVDEGELSRRLQLMDQDGNGQIDAQQFIKYMMEEVNNESLLEDLIDIFRIFDKENIGVMSQIKLKAITNGQVEEETLNNLMKMADSDDDGEMDYENYLKDLLEEDVSGKLK